MLLTGSCRCGAVTYALTCAALPPVYCCHCTDCQKWSGSAFAEQAVISEEAISVSGSVIKTSVTSRQGGQSQQYICNACYSRIYSTNPARPGVALLRAGTLDTASDLRPRAHIWAKSKQSWLSLPHDAAVFDESPPLDEFRAVLST